LIALANGVQQPKRHLHLVPTYEKSTDFADYTDLEGLELDFPFKLQRKIGESVW
jgi:hypothetical protein